MKGYPISQINSIQNEPSHDIISNQNNLKPVPSKMLEFVESNFMLSSLYKRLSKNETEHYKSLLNLKEYGYIIVLKLFSPHHFPVIDIIDELSLYSSIKMVLQDICISCIGPLLKNQLSILISLEEPPSSSELVKVHAHEIIIKIREIIEQEMSYKLRFGIGTPVELSNIFTSYIEASHALQIKGKSNNVYYSDIHKISKYTLHDISHYEERLVEVIRLNNEDDAYFYFSSIMSCISILDLDAQKNKILEILIILSKAITISRQTSAVYTDNIELAKTIISLKENELIEWAYHQFYQITKITKSQNVSDLSNRIVVATKEFLETHYTENITLEDAASNVSISPQYFSKVIKKSTGFNFVDWLSLIRIRKAKELLKSPHITVKEVCFLVGYKDPNYFSRIFKRRIGLTPSEYQKVVIG